MKRCALIVLFAAISLAGYALPGGAGGGGGAGGQCNGPNPPPVCACQGANPPPFCTATIPIDTHIWVLMIAGLGLAGYMFYKSKRKDSQASS